MFANRLQLVLMLVTQRHRIPHNALVYTNAFKNSFPGLQFENLAKKVKASDIFLESQSRNRICNRILMNVSQIVQETVLRCFFFFAV